MSKALRVIISGGGTGGHIFPAVLPCTGHMTDHALFTWLIMH